MPISDAMHDTRYNPHPETVISPLSPVGRYTRRDVPARAAAAVSQYFGVDTSQVFLTNSGTAALWLALTSLIQGSRRGVVMPSFICPQVATAVTRAGLRIQWCDIAPNRFVPSLSEYLTAIDSDTAAVICPSVLGQRPDVAGVHRYCTQRDILVLRDDAQSFDGSTTGDPPRAGIPRILSFGRAKPISLGRGGALIVGTVDHMGLVTPRWTRLPEDRGPTAHGRWHHDVGMACEAALGNALTPARMNDEDQALLAGAIACWPTVRTLWLSARHELIEALNAVVPTGAQTTVELADNGAISPYMVLRVPAQARYVLADRLARAGIETSWQHYPLHLLLSPDRTLPHTEATWPTTFCLPCRGDLTETERRTVLAAVEAAPWT